MAERWFQRRRDVVVTGSTCKARLGLGKLKEQQQPFYTYVLKKEKEHPDGKIVPFVYPYLRYFEERCDPISSENYPSFMVVSPD